MRALEKNPSRRFASVKQFADEFAWAYKVAQAKRQLPYPTPSLQKPVVQRQEMPSSLPLNNGHETSHDSRKS
jgi:hypothetical protein